MMSGARSLVRRVAGGGTLAAAALAAVLAFTALGHARAQTAQTAEPTCTGELTITPSTIYFNTAPEVEFRATGLDADSPFNLTIDGIQVGVGTTTPDGTMAYVTVLQPQVADLAQVQVQTVSACASGTLRVIGPARMNCMVTLINGVATCVLPGTV